MSQFPIFFCSARVRSWPIAEIPAGAGHGRLLGSICRTLARLPLDICDNPTQVAAAIGVNLTQLALWVANAYQAGFMGAHKDPLIGMGTAPLDDPLFRSAIFEQLGGAKLEGAVTTDICGKKDSHALCLDKEAVETMRKARLHQKVATTIFFESNTCRRTDPRPGDAGGLGLHHRAIRVQLAG
jgi:hypothetical protein